MAGIYLCEYDFLPCNNLSRSANSLYEKRRSIMTKTHLKCRNCLNYSLDCVNVSSYSSETLFSFATHCTAYKTKIECKRSNFFSWKNFICTANLLCERRKAIYQFVCSQNAGTIWIFYLDCRRVYCEIWKNDEQP